MSAVVVTVNEGDPTHTHVRRPAVLGAAVLMEQTEASHWSLADVQQPIAGFCQLEHAERFTTIVPLCRSVRRVFPELVGLFVCSGLCADVYPLRYQNCCTEGC